MMLRRSLVEPNGMTLYRTVAMRFDLDALGFHLQIALFGLQYDVALLDLDRDAIFVERDDALFIFVLLFGLDCDAVFVDLDHLLFITLVVAFGPFELDEFRVEEDSGHGIFVLFAYRRAAHAGRTDAGLQLLLDRDRDRHLLIVELKLKTLRRVNQALGDRIVEAGGGRLIHSIPQTADDKRLAYVAVIESHKHFVAGVRDEERAAIGAGHEHGDARPKWHV